MLSSLVVTLLVLTTTHSLLYTASDVIYDTASHKLRRGIPYYILPLLRGSGGGLKLSGDTNDACRFDVTQEPFDLNPGVPFIFNPVFLDEDLVRASYPTSIEAAVWRSCRGSRIWRASVSEKGDEEGGGQIVTTGGKFNTPESCFQVVEVDAMPGLRSYQIQHCPSKCGAGTRGDVTCYNVGVVSDANGKKYLALSDVIFPVVFANSFGKSTQSAE